MAAYPGAIPTFAGFTSSNTLAADNHAAQHNLEQTEIVALANKVGTGASVPIAGTFLKSSVNGESEWSALDIQTDTTGTLPVSRGGTGVDTEAELKALIGEYMYPVGSIYTNASDGTNPADLLGFGTWTAFGSGKVIVGLDSGDVDFDTVEETGGAKTHTHAAGSYGAMAEIFTSGAGGYIDWNSGPTTNWTATNRVQMSSAGAASSANSELTAASIEVNGTSGSSSSLPPYIVVRMWKRTA